MSKTRCLLEYLDRRTRRIIGFVIILQHSRSVQKASDDFYKKLAPALLRAAKTLWQMRENPLDSFPTLSQHDSPT